MEASLGSKEISQEIQNHLKNLKFTSEDLIKPILDYTDIIIREKDKKTNIIFFGSMSSGKTTTINLLLEYLRNISLKKSNSKTKESDVIFNLPSSEVENTYCFTFIENSEDSFFRVKFQIRDETDRNIFLKHKEFRNERVNNYNEIVKEYQHSEDGIDELIDFLLKIDDISFEALEVARKEHYSNEKPRLPPLIKIYVPNFPVKYRIVDTPGLSIKNFADNFMKTIEEFNYINFYVFVHNIESLVVYDMDLEILKNVNGDYGRPLIYSILTKGDQFMKKYSERNNKNTRDYDKFIILNNKYLNNLRALNFSGTLFRKLVSIEDKTLNNPIVEESLKYLWDDIEESLEKYGLSSYEHSVNLKLRKFILELNDKVEKENELDTKMIANIERKKLDKEIEFEDKMTDFLIQFSDYEIYKNVYPDHIAKLRKIYDDNEYRVDHEWSRKNYIQKHIEFAYPKFLEIILDGLNKIFLQLISDLLQTIDEKVVNILMNRLKDEGIIPDNFIGINGNSLLMASIIFLSTRAAFIGGSALAIELFTVAATSAWVPVVGWIVSGITVVGGILVGFGDYIGIWKKANTREDINKALFDTFKNNKGDIINRFKEQYSDFCRKFINKLKPIKVQSDKTKNLLMIMDKNKPKLLKMSDFGMNNEEFLKTIKNSNLKKFLTSSLNFKKEEN